MEWFALLVPVGAVLYMWRMHSRQALWWELLIPLGVGIILIAASRYFALYLHTLHEEYWTGYAVRAEYYEEWVEEVHHSEDIKDSDGNVIGTRTWTTYDTHPPEWYLIDNNDIKLGIDRSTYRALQNRWGNRHFEDVWRLNEHRDGDMYYTDYTGREEDMEVATTIHWYQNRIPVSNSPYRFPDVPKDVVKRYQLVSYPRVNGYDCPMILGASFPGKALADRDLAIINAKLGKSREVKIWVVLFRGQTQEAALKQQALWQGANMNEFVLCIGVDPEHRIEWAYAFSWTKVEELKVTARQHVQEQVGQPLDLREVVSWLGNEVNAKWIRRDFSEFNYLQVALPTWAYFVIYLVVIGATIGCSYWAITNGYDEDGTPRTFRLGRRYY